MKHKWIYSVLSVLFILTGCRNSTVYHTYRPTAESGWPSKDTLFYSLPSSLLPGDFRLHIGIRHTEVYPYKDVWVEVGCKEHAEKKDTFHLYLADQDGHWHNSTTGRLYQCDFDKGKLSLSAQDSTLYIIHLMSDSLLTGIHDVGIQLSLPGRIDAEEDKE